MSKYLLIVPCLFLVSCAHVDRSEYVSRPVTDQFDPEVSQTKRTRQRSRNVEREEFTQANETVRDRDDERNTTSLRQTAYQSDSPELPPAPGADDDQPAELSFDQSRQMTEAYTVDELVQMALVNNPTIQQAAAVVCKAQGIRQQVGLYPNPTVGYQGQEMGGDGTAGQQGAFISQTIVTGDKLQLGQNVVQQDVQQLSWELEAQRQRVSNDVRKAFYAALGAQRRVGLAQDLEDVAQAGVDAVNMLYKAEQAARPDILQAEVQLGEVSIIRQNAEYDYEAAWKDLASYIGRPDLTPTPLYGELEGETPELDWQVAYNQLLASSPELQAACYRVHRARAQLRRQEAQPTPNLLTQFGVAHDNSSDDDIASVQVGIPLPVFNRNQGNIYAANSEYHRAYRDVERLKMSLRIRLTDAFRDYQKARQQAERYRLDIIPKAQENLDLTNEGYQLQQFDFLRVLTARRTYFETNLSYISSLIVMRQAVVAIQGNVLAGGLDDVNDYSSAAGDSGIRGDALNTQ